MDQASLTVTAKGQVTLKRAFLDHLGIRPGEKILAVLAPGGRVELAPERPAADISAAFGILHRPGLQPLSPEELDHAIADAIIEEIREGEMDA